MSFQGCHFHTAHGADFRTFIALAEQIKDINFRLGQLGYQHEIIQEAVFALLYPLEFAADFLRNHRPYRGTAVIGILHAGDQLLLSGIFQHIIGYSQLKGLEYVIIILVGGEDDDFYLGILGQDLAGRIQACGPGFHFNIHQNDIGLAEHGFHYRLIAVLNGGNHFKLAVFFQQPLVFFQKRGHILRN